MYLDPAVDTIRKYVHEATQVTNFASLGDEEMANFEAIDTELVHDIFGKIGKAAASANDAKLMLQLARMHDVNTLHRCMVETLKWMKKADDMSLNDANAHKIAAVRAVYRRAVANVDHLEATFKKSENDKDFHFKSFDDTNVEQMRTFIEACGKQLGDILSKWAQDINDLKSELKGITPEWSDEGLKEEQVQTNLLKNPHYNRLGTASQELFIIMEANKILLKEGGDFMDPGDKEDARKTMRMGIDAVGVTYALYQVKHVIPNQDDKKVACDTLRNQVKSKNMTVQDTLEQMLKDVVKDVQTKKK